MNLQPFSFLKTLSKEELPSFECSDRIVFPKLFYETMGFAENDLIILHNKRNQSITGTLFGIQDISPNTIFVPTWMIQHMSLLDNIVVAHATKHRCITIQLKPHSQTFSKRPDFVPQLNKAIMNYRSLTKKTRIPLLIEDNLEFLTIEAILPSKHETFFVYGCGSVNIQILECVECEKSKLTYLFSSKEFDNPPIAFVGKGYTCGGVMDLMLTPAEAATKAARRRMELQKAGKR